ncbi:MAG: NTP transferase domain-containing protein [Candidatus Levybacteria bacterium]|nr:NTP transferase domain-containing protein [Candidatus Levybacteria bacterium]
MTAVLLAAGESSRFYPYNELGHKSLVTLCGKKLIAHTLDSLRKSNIKNVIIVENKNKSVSKSLSSKEKKGLTIRFIVQETPTGMGDAVLLCKPFIKETFFLLNAYHFEFSEVAKELLKISKKDQLALLTKEEKDAKEFGSVELKNGKMVISEKKNDKASDRIVGIYCLPIKFLDVLEKEKKTHYSFENALSSYSQKHNIELVKTNKETLSLKYPWDLLKIKDYMLERLKKHKGKGATISKRAILHGEVYIDDGATIMDGAVITGPCYIGKHAYIGTNSIIRGGSLVEDKVVIGANLEVKNSILMRGVKTHSGFIGDSLVGENTKIAAGYNSANVRLDKENVKVKVKGESVSTGRKYFGAIIGSGVSFGIRVGTMPGIVIGNNDLVGPGTTVMENLEDNITYYTEIKGVVTRR